MTSPGAGDTSNNLTGANLQGPVLQGRDFHNSTFITNQAAAAPVALAQLPAPVAGFTGRKAELAEVTSLLDPAAGGGAVVVSAVAGLAGVGKTALTIQAAHTARAAGWFGGGVLFIDLHGYDDQAVQPAQALDALLRALGIPADHIPPGTDERAGLYRSALAGNGDPVLVVADNASSEAQVRPLLPGAGPHRVLVTSRHTLAGLGARLVDVTVLDEQAAIMLLEQVLRAARPGDDRITSNRNAARQLATVSGGLPLALRITAALLVADPTLTAAELADLLADEISRLETLHYDDGGASGQSVAAAFDLSYRHLDEAAAELFRLLSVNPGPDVSTAAAAALAGQPVSRTRPVLGRLVKAHLIEPAGTGAGRWRMHDLLRLYARQLPAVQSQAEERKQAWDRLLAYYLNRLRTADDHLRALPGMPVPAGFTDREEALVWLDTERPSLIAAATMAARAGRDQIALSLPLLLADYLDWRRRFDDKLTVLAISRDAARRLGSRKNEAVALTGIGIALAEARRLDEAITAHQDAVAIFRKTGDRNREGITLNNLGGALQGLRRFDEAITAHQDAAAIFREVGDRQGEGRALNNLGNALRELRRFDEAITAHQDAAAIYQETGDRHGKGSALNNLGIVLREVGRFDEAITAHQDAAAIFRESIDRYFEGRALNNLGSALKDVGRFDEGITAHQDAAAIYRETGDRHGEGGALNNLGNALVEVRGFDEAITAHQDAVAIFRETGDRYSENVAQQNLKLAQAAKAAATEK
ncbi:MAG: tetratricopeptide repeat protein [Streptosporangiaceae bacterium]